MPNSKPNLIFSFAIALSVALAASPIAALVMSTKAAIAQPSLPRLTAAQLTDPNIILAQTPTTTPPASDASSASSLWQGLLALSLLPLSGGAFWLWRRQRTKASTNPSSPTSATTDSSPGVAPSSSSTPTEPPQIAPSTAALPPTAPANQSPRVAPQPDAADSPRFDSTLASVDQGLAELPAGYGESRIVLMPTSPQLAYAYWDMPNTRREAVRQQGGERLALRLYDVTDVNITVQNPHSVQQYDIDELARQWYLAVPVSDRDYLVEIGYLANDGRWLMLARSQPIRIPPIYPSDWDDAQFLTIPWDDQLRDQPLADFNTPSDRPGIHDLMYALSLGAEAHRVPASIQTVSSPEFTAASANLSGIGMSGIGMSGIGMSGIGMSGIGVRMSGVGMGMSGVGMSGIGMSGVGMGMSGVGMSGVGMSGVGMNMSGAGMNMSGAGMNMSGAGMNMSGVGMGMSGVGMSGVGMGMSGVGMNMSGVGMGMSGVGMGMSGVGMSGVGMNMSGIGMNMSGVGMNMSGVGMNMSGIGMSGVGFSASMPPLRSRKFWMIADAELIVYGATEPDATVTIAGQPVRLNPDGTFRFQMAFPDGTIDYPILAIAADGVQTRSIHLTFNRTTPERYTNTKEDAFEEPLP